MLFQGGEVEAEFLDLAPERRAMHFKDFGGLGGITSGFGHGIADTLGFIKEVIGGEGGGGGRDERIGRQDWSGHAAGGAAGAFEEARRQVGGGDRRPIGDNEGALHDVAEFADVAGPVVIHQEAHRLARDRVDRLVEALVEELAEVVDEQGDIAGALDKRGDVDRDNIDAVEEVLAEAPLADQRGEVAIGGAEDAHVDGDGAVLADGVNQARLQDAQQFGLEGFGGVADFVEEQGAAVGFAEAPLARGDGAGEGAADVAEEFAFEDFLGEGGAVDGDKGFAGAVGFLVDGARDEFLAHAGGARNQDGGGQGGDAADQFAELDDGSVFADEAVK